MPKKNAGRASSQSVSKQKDDAVATRRAPVPKKDGMPENIFSIRTMLHVGLLLLLGYKLWAMQQIPIKTDVEVQRLREAGRVAAELLMHLSPMVQPGVSTDALDEATVAFCNSRGIRAAPLNYGGLLPQQFSPPAAVCTMWGWMLFPFVQLLGLLWPSARGIAIPLSGFPKSLCVSVNDVVCHGIPGPTVLHPGDIVNLDVTVVVDGYHGDSSLLILVGGPPLDQQSAKSIAEGSVANWSDQIRLGVVARECLFAGLREVRAGARLGDIAAAVQAHAQQAGFSVVTTYGGHGIGAEFHEPPHVLHVGERGMGPTLKSGMVLTVEPMINAGSAGVVADVDQWTIRTADGSLSAQWEHMVLVRDDGCEVLTWRPGEKSPDGFPLDRLPQPDNR